MHKLSPELKEALADLKNSEGARALLIEIENQVAALERDLFTIALDGREESERTLMYRHAAVTGAKKIQATVRILLGAK